MQKWSSPWRRVASKWVEIRLLLALEIALAQGLPRSEHSFGRQLDINPNRVL